MGGHSVRIPKKFIVLGISIVFVAIVLWLLFFRVTFIHISTPEGADTFRITSAVSGKQLATKSGSGTVLVARDSYIIRYLKGKEVVGVETQNTAILPYKSISQDKTPNANLATIPILHQKSDFVTPLPGGGYIYLNKQTRGIEIATQAGSRDVSTLFGLAQLTNTSEAPTYNRVVSIVPTSIGSVVTTTKAIFTLTNDGDIQEAPLLNIGFDPNFTASSYDKKSNSLYLLNADSPKTIYRYTFGENYQGLQAFYTGDREFDSVQANGGHVAAYSQNIPSIDPVATVTYEEQKQLTPLLIDVATKKVEEPTTRVMTTVFPSETGKFVALKQKFATTLIIQNRETKQETTIPAYDTTAINWRGDTLYIGRDNAVWSFEAGKDIYLSKVAEIGQPAIRLLLNDESMTVSGLTNTAFAIRFNGESTGMFANTKDIAFESPDYAVTYTYIGGTLVINVSQPGEENNADTYKENPELEEAVTKLTAAFPGSQPILQFNTPEFYNPYEYATASSE